MSEENHLIKEEVEKKTKDTDNKVLVACEICYVKSAWTWASQSICQLCGKHICSECVGELNPTLCTECQGSPTKKKGN